MPSIDVTIARTDKQKLTITAQPVEYCSACCKSPPTYPTVQNRDIAPNTTSASDKMTLMKFTSLKPFDFFTTPKLTSIQ